MDTKYSGRPQNKTQIHKYKKHAKKKRMMAKRVQERRMGVLGIFLSTLGGVLILGCFALIGISLPKYLKIHQYDNQISFVNFVETIPQTLVMEEVVEEPEVLGANAALTKYGEVIRDEEYLRENNIFLKDGGSEDEVTLGFCGDILFDDEYSVMSSLKLRGGNLSASMSQELLEKMNGVDVMVVNNEFPYTQRGSRRENKQFTFRADYDTAFYLNDMGADVAILANNHAYDFGEEGLLDTLETLNNVGVHPVGAGRNIEEAIKPVYYIINDIKIAIIASTQIERLSTPDTIGAGAERAGVFRCWGSNNEQMLYNTIKVAKENADFVVVCVHWGTEKDEVPDTWQIQMAPKLAEAGADAIIGDHTHRLQGIYYYGDVPCIYSLGNFWFNGTTIDTCMVELTFNKDGLKSFQFLPAVQENYSTRLVYDSEKQRIINYEQSLSKGATIDPEGFVHKN